MSAALRSGRWRRLWDHDLSYSLRRSPIAMLSVLVTLAFFVAAIGAPILAPHTPFDPASLELNDANKPPAWVEGGDAKFLLGTDSQGRDILSTLMYGARISLLVGFAAVIFAIVLGVGLGVMAGYFGGWFETVVMRVADVQLTIPAILLALLIDGIARAALPPEAKDRFAYLVMIVAIGLTYWPQFARVTRGATLVEKSKDYVASARIIGVPAWSIMARHILPNVLGPVLVIATINFALAIITEATLSFLGVGLPPTLPSLGTLIRVGKDYLFSGEWWITLSPALALCVLALAVNLLGDWLRDALNPKLR